MLPAMGVTAALGPIVAIGSERDRYVEDLKECIQVVRDDEGEVSEVAFFESPNLGATEETISHKGNHGAISMINSGSTEILIIGSATRIRRLR
jgi:hypothetical protein